MKRYVAIIWNPNSKKLDKRVSVVAEDLTRAKEKLEAQHGKGNVFNLHNEEDAARPR